MYNNLRLTYYANAFLQTILTKYKDVLNYIPVTYFRFSQSNSVYDNELLYASNWEPFGKYSGLLWYKILYFPLSFVEEIRKSETGVEAGVYSLSETYAVFPYIKFRPIELDFVLFSFNNNIDEVLYQVTNIETIYKDDRNELNFYRVRLKSTGYNLNDISSHIISTYAYDEVTDDIYTLDDFDRIITSYKNIMQLLKDINQKIIPSIGMREV